ncbi:hypothetical protein [Deinococcus aquaedulcis]|uniref:hypothetical protein n=1 Tax=Deinococcus aquaedulcis TaxID=2840455 RepID=UPI001C83C8E0|nr:hypothetical protein [Deinococcus aquaedulcis]
MAWLSLEPADNDPARFVRRHAAAFQVPVFDAALHNLPEVLTCSSPENAVAALWRALGWQGSPTVLVLHDYHVIQAGPVHHLLTALLGAYRPHLHLVIVTWEDPPLPLARLRAQGDLLEVRAAELRFS